MRVSFHGAAREVTGSCHLFEIGKKKILTDCGMFQGRKINGQNKEPFDFDPSKIDYLLLSHAHLDHCGRIPYLVKNGFQGEIITTAPSRDLAQLVLLDSAHIQEEEADREARHRKSHPRDHKAKGNPKAVPLYTKDDVYDAMDYFVRTVNYDEPTELSDEIQATFLDAGHMLGSASIVLNVKEGGRNKRIVFSGDIGNHNMPILNDPTLPPEADIVIMETTYGNRSHKPIELSIEELNSAIDATFNNSGNVYIPTFALECAQEILYFLREGVEATELPHDMQVYLDSPMAISATEIFRQYPTFYNGEAKKLFKANIDPFSPPNLTFTRSKEESMKINDIKSGAIVLAGSGMCHAGRILHHLKNNLPRKECSFIFIKFAAEGTLARKIIDGAKYVRIFGHDVPVRAKIYTIGGFSGHAGQDGLLSWHRKTKKPDTTFLVHGSDEAMTTFADELRAKGCNTEMPQLHQKYHM